MSIRRMVGLKGDLLFKATLPANDRGLIDAGKGLNLTRSPYNYDRMTLLYIMDKSYR